MTIIKWAIGIVLASFFVAVLFAHFYSFRVR